jgi:carboxyl-terminal processing protease
MDEHRKDIQNKYKKFEEFDKKFDVDDALLEALFNFAESQKLPREDAAIATSKTQIQLVVKAYIARILWGNGEYYRVINKPDKVIQKAIEVLLKPSNDPES